MVGPRTLYHRLQEKLTNVPSGDTAFQNQPHRSGSPREGEIFPAAAVNSDSTNLFELLFAASCQLNVPELSSYEIQWSRAAGSFCVSEDENRAALSSVATVVPSLHPPALPLAPKVKGCKRSDGGMNHGFGNWLRLAPIGWPAPHWGLS